MTTVTGDLPSSRERWVRLALFAIAIVGILLGINTTIHHLASDPLSDVRAYYEAGARLNAGLPLYTQPATTNDAEFYRYPPLLAIIFRPLALFPFALAAAIWEALMAVALVLTVVVLRPAGNRLAVVAILALPIMWSLTIGQAQVLSTLLIAMASPWSIALATHLKIFPAAVAIWWLARRDWHSIGRFLLWVGGLGLLQLVLEPAGTLAFPTVFNLALVGDVRNLSPYAISPVLWAGLVLVGVVAALRLGPGRWGWAAAVALSVLASPRLLVYQLMTLVDVTRTPAIASDPSRR